LFSSGIVENSWDFTNVMRFTARQRAAAVRIRPTDMA
jgi:hypothetical protein